MIDSIKVKLWNELVGILVWDPKQRNTYFYLNSTGRDTARFHCSSTTVYCPEKYLHTVIRYIRKIRNCLFFLQVRYRMIGAMNFLSNGEP